AALQIRDVLRERILEDVDRRRAAGKGPDALLWVLEGLAADWSELHDILTRASAREREASRGAPVEDERPGWASPIAERLTESLAVLGALARSLERPGLQQVRELGSSVTVARGKLFEVREMLLTAR